METWWNLDPWQELRRLQKETSRLFDDVLGGRHLGETRGLLEGGETRGRELQRGRGREMWGGRIKPKVNMKETDKELCIEVELPGIRREHVNVELSPDGNLVIWGEKHDEHRQETDRFMLAERKFGHFRRELPLPQGIEPGNIKANFVHGVLEVTIPKPAGWLSRKKIEIAERPMHEIGGESTRKRGVSGGGGTRIHW